MLGEAVKKELEKIYGSEIRYPKDCDALADTISRKTGSTISSSTMKRLLGFIQATSNPSQHTLDTIAVYLGHATWEEFKTSKNIRNGDVVADVPSRPNASSGKRRKAIYASILLLIAVASFAFFKFFYAKIKPAAVLQSQLLASMPEPSEGGKVVSLNDVLYYVGGSNQLFTKQHCWRYQIASNSWQKLAPMPTARAEMATALVDNKIYVFGGWLGEGTTNVAEVYDIETDTWNTLPPLPVNITCASAVAIERDIYILGGTLGETKTYFFKYNISSATYESLPAFSQSMMYSAMVLSGNVIYALGGQSYSFKDFAYTWHNRVYAFDVAKREWLEKSPMPASLNRSSAVLIDDKIHLMGGLKSKFSHDNAGIVDTHFIYDLDDDRWETGPRLPYAVCAHQLFPLDNRILLFGGISNFPHSVDKVVSLILP